MMQKKIISIPTRPLINGIYSLHNSPIPSSPPTPNFTSMADHFMHKLGHFELDLLWALLKKEEDPTHQAHYIDDLKQKYTELLKEGKFSQDVFSQVTKYIEEIHTQNPELFELLVVSVSDNHKKILGSVSIEGDSIALAVHSIPVLIFGLYCSSISIYETILGMSAAPQKIKSNRFYFNLIQFLSVTLEVLGLGGDLTDKEGLKSLGAAGLFGVALISLMRVLFIAQNEGVKGSKDNLLFLGANTLLSIGTSIAGSIRINDNESDNLQIPAVSIISLAVIMSIYDRTRNKEKLSHILFLPFIDIYHRISNSRNKVKPLDYQDQEAVLTHLYGYLTTLRTRTLEQP